MRLMILLFIFMTIGCQTPSPVMQEQEYQQFEHFLEAKLQQYQEPLPVHESIPHLYTSFMAIKQVSLVLSKEEQDAFVKKEKSFVYFQLLRYGEELYHKIHQASWNLLSTLKEFRNSLQEMQSPTKTDKLKDLQQKNLHTLQQVIALVNDRIRDLEMILFVCEEMLLFAANHRD